MNTHFLFYTDPSMYSGNGAYECVSGAVESHTALCLKCFELNTRAAASSCCECSSDVLRPYGILYLVRRWVSATVSTNLRYRTIHSIGSINSRVIVMASVIMPPLKIVSTIICAIVVQL
jgi:hypothetical protein